MSINPQDLPQYEGKKIILVLKTDDGAKEFEGTAEAASEAALGFKEKGKRDLVLVEPDAIEEISLVPEKPKKVTQKKMKPIAEGNVRQHLADRHGIPLSDLKDVSEEDAKKAHDNMDHSDLGHKHVAEEKEDEAAEKSAA